MTDQLRLSHPPGPPREPTQEEQREDILDALDRWRGKAVALGRAAAEDIAQHCGRVTSTDVLETLRVRGHGPLLDSIDPRWVGCVFRDRKKWKRDGAEATGSHGRYVTVWRLR